MSNDSREKQLEELQQLLQKGSITQEQFDLLAKDPAANTPESQFPPPLSSDKIELGQRRRRRLIVIGVALLVLFASAGLVTKMQIDSQNRKEAAEEKAAEDKAAEEKAAKEKAAEEKAAEQKAAEEKAAEEKAAEQKAAEEGCSELANVSIGINTYLEVVNQNTDYGEASSLRQAREWAGAKITAASSFRRILKDISIPSVATERNALIDTINQMEDWYTIQSTATEWSLFNDLVESLNLLGNDFNEQKDDLYSALGDVCAEGNF